MLEEALNRRRTKLGREHPETLRSTNALARAYLANRPAQAESLAREALAILEKQRPDDWFTFDTRSLLGGGLLGQQKYADAEPLLLQGYEGMKAQRVQDSCLCKEHRGGGRLANCRALRPLGQEGQGRRVEETPVNDSTGRTSTCAAIVEAFRAEHCWGSRGALFRTQPVFSTCNRHRHWPPGWRPRRGTETTVLRRDWDFRQPLAHVIGTLPPPPLIHGTSRSSQRSTSLPPLNFLRRPLTSITSSAESLAVAGRSRFPDYSRLRSASMEFEQSQYVVW